MSAPKAVKDFLTLHFAGQEYESFVVIFLDAQHRVIKASELFRGTLTQTSVYRATPFRLAVTLLS